MSVLETPQQLQPHVSIYISLDLTLQLSKTKVILSLIGLEHPGSGPQHFTSAALHLPHCVPAPNSPVLGSMSSTWLDIILETSKLVRSLLHSKSSYESHLLPHEIYILDRMEKGLAYPASLDFSSFGSCFEINAQNAPKANSPQGPFNTPTVSQTPVILKTLVTHARQPSFCPCYLLNSTHSFGDSTKMSPTWRISSVPSLEVEAPTFSAPGPLFMLLSQVIPHCNRALMSPSHSV